MSKDRANAQSNSACYSASSFAYEFLLRPRKFSLTDHRSKRPSILSSLKGDTSATANTANNFFIQKLTRRAPRLFMWRSRRCRRSSKSELFGFSTL
jgi:hypothetical protein